MKIVVATPLYPPDIADPAPYAKELTKRLSREHEVVVVTYGRIPEEVPGVTIRATDKRLPMPLRVAGFTLSLFRALRGADIVCIQSGASAELPALLALPFFRVRIYFRQSVEPETRSPARAWLRRTVSSWATRVESGTELTRPEILPFAPRPDAALHAWESAWEKHIGTITV